MLTQLWAKAIADPPLAAAGFLMVVAALVFLSVFVQVLLEAKRTKPTTLAEMKRDAVTLDRRRRLKLLQSRRPS